jgi:hypothetical protein
MVCQLDFPNNPFRQFPKTHYSSVPSFQHSNWGEAHKFSYLISSGVAVFYEIAPGDFILYFCNNDGV